MTEKFIEIGGPKKVFKRRVYIGSSLPKKTPAKVKIEEAWFMELAQELKLARFARSLTQRQLAELVGSSQGFISNFESCQINPSVKFISKIAKTLGKDISVVVK